jgi:hypothetical protein
MYLPLNFIPIVGTVVFILLQGRNRGNSVHTRVSLGNSCLCSQIFLTICSSIFSSRTGTNLRDKLG